MQPDAFSQAGYRCRLGWGFQGARDAADRGDILVIVDVLRFSTTVATAVYHGVALYPCLETEDVAEIAQRLGAVAAVKKRHRDGDFTLSPRSFVGAIPGTRVAIASLNGAACSRYGAMVPHLLIGALVNARAVSAAVTALLSATERSVTINACGERWQTPSEDGDLRFALEDYLGTGAILAGILFSKSPEARVCEAAFQQSQNELAELLLQSGSGRELVARGQSEDVTDASRLNVYDAVPILVGQWFVDSNTLPV